MGMDISAILSNLTIKDKYTHGYEQSKIISGLKKLPALFMEISKEQKPIDTDKRIIALIFYIGVLSEFKNGALYVDCAALAKRYRTKSPSPGMREVNLLPKIGFNIVRFNFIDNIKGKKGRIDELSELIVSHDDEEIMLAIKVFATACNLNGRDYFHQLDYRLLAHDASGPYKPSLSETLPVVQIKDILNQEKFNIIDETDKDFILLFNDEMRGLGYDFGGDIGTGYRMGKYMIIYSKVGVKATQVAARIYIRENSILLRMYFSDIDNHRDYIENASAHIKSVFTDEHGKCNHCENGHRKDGFCKFRKSYTIDGLEYEKCNGVVFEFRQPNEEKLLDYMGLLREFYAKKERLGK